MPYQSTWNNPFMPNPLQSQTIATGGSLVTMPYQMPTQSGSNGIIRVNGPNSALQFHMPPNSTSPALFDYDGKTFYVVSTDGTGMKSLETFDYTEHVDEQPTIDFTSFVSRGEFDEFVAKVNTILGALNELQTAVPATNEQPSGAKGNGKGKPSGALQQHGSDES